MTRAPLLIAAVAVAASSVAAGCGDGDGGGGGELVFTRSGDGSTFAISEATVTCQEVDTSKGGRQALLVIGPPSVFDDRGEDGPSEPFFRLEAIVEGGAPGGRIAFPDETYSDGAGVSFFVGDPGEGALDAFEDFVPGGGGANELSAAEEEAEGEIVFHHATCDPQPRVDFSVDARLGSEFFEQPSVTVEGSFSGSGG